MERIAAIGRVSARRCRVSAAALTVATVLGVVVGPGTRPEAAGASGAPIGTPGPGVSVGSGAVEANLRQAVRTVGNRVYIAAVDDKGYWGASGPREVKMYRADQTGIPTSFGEADAAHRPSVSASAKLSGGDVRYDPSTGLIHVLWWRGDTDRFVWQQFDTATDTWRAGETITGTGAAGVYKFGGRGAFAGALAVDADGVPFVAVGGTSLRVYRRSGTDTWTLDATLPGGSGSNLVQHPALTFDRTNRLHLAWLLDGEKSINYALREADGTWGAREVLAAGYPEVIDNYSLDQAPAVSVDSADRPVVLWISSHDYVRVKVKDAQGNWVSDNPSPAVWTHAPSLHTSGDDRFALLGHDDEIHSAYLSHAAGAAGWSDTYAFQPAGDYDGSMNSRYDPLYDTDCGVIDVVYFDEDSDTRDPGSFQPDLFYAAIQLQPNGGTGACRAIPGRGAAGPLPYVVPGLAAVTEPDAGSTVAEVPVWLTDMYGNPRPMAEPVTVSFATYDWSAHAAGDYTPVSGTLTFAPGETAKTLEVQVVGDVVADHTEYAFVLLSAPVGGRLGGIGPGLGFVAIADDDPPPEVSVGPASVVEGSAGTRYLRVPVTAAGARDYYFVVGYSTSDGTATAGSDYTAATGSLLFGAGSSLRYAAIEVTGDAVVEADETVTVTVSAAARDATVATATATATITNDD